MKITPRPVVTSLSRALSRALCSSSASDAATFPLKNVTKSNFEPALAELRRHVAASDFVAVDLEMSGVTSAPWRDSLEFDRADVSYLKVKDSAEKFAVLQLGVCPFRWDSSKQSFIAHPHNFYIFPRQELQFKIPSYEFLCQATSIDFLAKYQFDFNVCIHEGISYLSRGQESEALRCLRLTHQDEYNLKEVKDVPLDNNVDTLTTGRTKSIVDTLFTEKMKNTFTAWRDGLLRNRKGGFQVQGNSNNRQQLQTIFFKMRPALSLSGFTSHQLRLIQLVITRNFQDLLYVQVDGENSSQQKLVVHTDSKDDKETLMKEMKDEQLRQAEMKIQAAVGFRHVIDLLSSEEKLIVGHNCLLDIAHIYSKFVGPLPSTAEEFVSSVNKFFPHIIDTKVLLNANNVLQQRMRKHRTSLSSAFASLCPQISRGAKSTDLAYQLCVKVEVQVDDLRSSNWNSGAKHEAGYDAFMTGCVFAQACGHLGIDFDACLPSEMLAQNEKLQKQTNLLFLSWSQGDIIDLTTGNMSPMLVVTKKNMKYQEILFKNIALIWGFSSKMKSKEIRECISKVFGPSSVVSIYHMDETAVFVQFNKQKLVSEFLHLKDSLETNDGPASVLHPLAVLLEGGNTRAADYETYKEICSSPKSEVLFADQAEAFGIKWKTKLVEPDASLDSIECQSSGENNAVTSTSKSESLETKNTHNVKSDSSSAGISNYKIIDSLIAARGDQVRPNL